MDAATLWCKTDSNQEWCKTGTSPSERHTVEHKGNTWHALLLFWQLQYIYQSQGNLHKVKHFRSGAALQLVGSTDIELNNVPPLLLSNRKLTTPWMSSERHPCRPLEVGQLGSEQLVINRLPVAEQREAVQPPAASQEVGNGRAAVLADEGGGLQHDLLFWGKCPPEHSACSNFLISGSNAPPCHTPLAGRPNRREAGIATVSYHTPFRHTNGMLSMVRARQLQVCEKPGLSGTCRFGRSVGGGSSREGPTRRPQDLVVSVRDSRLGGRLAGGHTRP